MCWCYDRSFLRVPIHSFRRVPSCRLCSAASRSSWSGCLQTRGTPDREMLRWERSRCLHHCKHFVLLLLLVFAVTRTHRQGRVSCCVCRRPQPTRRESARSAPCEEEPHQGARPPRVVVCRTGRRRRVCYAVNSVSHTGRAAGGDRRERPNSGGLVSWLF